MTELSARLLRGDMRNLRLVTTALFDALVDAERALDASEEVEAIQARDKARKALAEALGAEVVSR